MSYQPPLTVDADIIRLVAVIGERLGRLAAQAEQANALRLRRANRIRTIQGSLAIEGNTLSEAQITAILEGKRVIAPPREVQEVRNAIAAYDAFERWKATDERDLLKVHELMMRGLIDDAGHYRPGGVGVMSGDTVVHMAPPASRVPTLMRDLLGWLASTDQHPLISSCVFHYEFEFIHPFADGNGRMGRLWQSLILAQWHPVFAHIPVESVVHVHQGAYYEAINSSTAQTDAAPFVRFMLTMLADAMLATTPQVAPQVTPQVRQLLEVLANAGANALSRSQLQARLDLQDRKSFRERYLGPALDAGAVTMTLPDRPNSRLQQYRLTELGRGCIKAGRKF